LPDADSSLRRKTPPAHAFARAGRHIDEDARFAYAPRGRPHTRSLGRGATSTRMLDLPTLPSRKTFPPPNLHSSP
jgi:hypothetical protein